MSALVLLNISNKLRNYHHSLDHWPSTYIHRGDYMSAQVLLNISNKLRNFHHSLDHPPST